ncbi:hypothetical protein SAMN04487969_12569 [Paenibacillus algorifonticola]|uniref:PQQ-like domain-containing protein n=1 Tax=Paenibacillus algorifonticola TaxID=684063 RepID=A0A1I2HNS8_9BACL|nr:hypothetical protein [Paenibacillus algorifonticola]SFF32015.1 hypothetical protein SAMN04487969_12569 [Paenibacillus algorifonticola]
MPFHLISLPALSVSPGPIAVMHPLPDEQNVSVLALNHACELWKLNLTTGLAENLLQIDIPDLNISHPLQVVVSKDGQYAAISNRFGRHAAVYDLLARQQIMKLSRDDYHSEVCTFPLAFAEIDGRSLLIHGTLWNRVDLTDVESGELLSKRPNAQYEDDGYLDYFHGKLYVSQDQQWIVDMGWVWQPVGVIRSWNVRDWLNNAREAEDGASVSSPWDVLLDWDLPAAWVDSQTMAIWGQVDGDQLDEEDWPDEGVLPVVILSNVLTGERSTLLRGVPAYATTSPIEDVFPHPQGQLAADGDLLFLWGKGLNMTVWNRHNSAQVATEEAFCPDLYHEKARLFLQLDSQGGISAWRYTA